jgi:hypothetical protein
MPESLRLISPLEGEMPAPLTEGGVMQLSDFRCSSPISDMEKMKQII